MTAPTFIRRVISDRPIAYSYGEAAERLRISLRSVELLVAQGELAAARIGPGRGRRIITEQAIQDYLARCQEEAEAERQALAERYADEDQIAELVPLRRRNMA